MEIIIVGIWCVYVMAFADTTLMYHAMQAIPRITIVSVTVSLMINVVSGFLVTRLVPVGITYVLSGTMTVVTMMCAVVIYRRMLRETHGTFTWRCKAAHDSNPIQTEVSTLTGILQMVLLGHTFSEWLF